MIGEEILVEIDATLDQLILNAEAIQNVEINDLCETELDAFQKTQESLLQHLIHMDARLEEKRKSLKVQNGKSVKSKIQGKLMKFEKLESSYHKKISAVHNRPLLSKRRNKKFLELC